MCNQFKSVSASYLERTSHGFTPLGTPIYRDTEIAYTYLFKAYVFGVKPESLDTYFASAEDMWF